MVTKTTIESVVLASYSKVLVISPTRFTLSTDFVNLGGNSLKAAEIAAALKKTYPALVITPEDVLRCRTAGGLSDFIKRQGI